MSSIGMYSALSGLNAQQAAMNAASNDIANVNTPGYTRTRANLVTVVGGGVLDSGAGVVVMNIQQLRDAFLTSRADHAAADAAQAQVSSDGLNNIQEVFGEGSLSALAGKLDAFWSSWDTLANNPSVSGGEQTVLAKAADLTQSLNSRAQQLQAAQTSALGQVSSNLETVNQVLGQVAKLNNQITSLGPNNANANSLIDQRQQLLTQLSTLAGTTSRNEQDGSVSVSIGGMRVVQEDISDTLSLSTSSPGVVLSSLAKLPVPLTGGTIGGLSTLARVTIPSYETQLDSVATSLASTVNGQLAAGYTKTGVAGSTLPMFTSTLPMSAATISLNTAVSGASGMLALSGASDGSDTKNAQAMAELGSAPTGPDATYRAVIGKLGLDAAGAKAASAGADALSSSAQQASDSISGVNLDEELANMLQFQNAYAAAAKTITAINMTVQSLLAAV